MLVFIFITEHVSTVQLGLIFFGVSVHTFVIFLDATNSVIFMFINYIQ